MDREIQIGRRGILAAATLMGVGALWKLNQPTPAEQAAINACRSDYADPNFASQNPDKVRTNLEVTQPVNLRKAPNANDKESHKDGQLLTGQSIPRAYAAGYDGDNGTIWIGIPKNGNCGDMNYVAEKYTRRAIFSKVFPRP